MQEKKTIKITITLKQYLDSVGITSYVLGKWVNGVSPQTVYAIANGTRRPSLEVLEKILSSLHSHGYPASLEDIIQIEAKEN
ncbi:MAG: helix-turn-helix transcriptional regulator [Nostoc sp.]|uniref:helix-turn-helix transcriptional regulator n=1 Tax=Nostoc sp. TaxID=1180 RepID=UPI002FFA1262